MRYIYNVRPRHNETYEVIVDDLTTKCLFNFSVKLLTEDCRVTMLHGSYSHEDSVTYLDQYNSDYIARQIGLFDYLHDRIKTSDMKEAKWVCR